MGPIWTIDTMKLNFVHYKNMKNKSLQYYENVCRRRMHKGPWVEQIGTGEKRKQRTPTPMWQEHRGCGSTETKLTQ